MKRERERRPLRAEPPFQATVEALVRGGDGLVRAPDGRLYMVPYVVPGDVVRVSPIGKTEGHLETVVTPSPARQKPACRWFGACGGCPLMMLDREAQRAHHVETLKNDLTHALKLSPPDIHVHAGSEDLGYRARARLHFKVKQGRAQLGYLAGKSRDIVDIDTCVALHPVLDRARRSLLDAFSTKGLTAIGEVHLALAEGRDGSRAVADIALDGDFNAELVSKLANAIGEGFAGIQLSPKGASAPARYGDPRPRQIGADGVDLLFPPGGFAQTSSLGAKTLAEIVTAVAEPKEQKVLELYAGSGTLSVLLAREAKSFVAIEGDAGAARSLGENLAARGLQGKVVQGDVATAVLPKADVVVLDPPRSGAWEALDAIAALHAKRIVYVSCNGSTLARDLKHLTARRYALTALHLVELFPHTGHVEVVARLDRDRSSRASS